MIKKVLKLIKNKLFRFPRILLWCVFRFDKWHISPLSEHRYAQDIIKYLNSCANNREHSLVEIGCGLGDIVRNASCRSRLGLDHEPQVLRAAAFLAKVTNERNIIYKMFDFPKSELDGKYDVIIMVNWIHHIQPDVLRAKISQYLEKNLTQGGSVLIDTVQAQDYEYNHSIDYLTEGLSCQIHKLGDYANLRKVFAIQTEEPCR